MKKKKIKSAIPVYGVAALWLLLGIICPGMLLKGWFLLVAAALSVAAYLALSKVFPGRVIETRDAVDSGNAEIDALIEKGRKQLDSLYRANIAIPDPVISKDLDRMAVAGEAIFRLLEKDTGKADAVRRFMNYYLPTAEKLMNNYQLMMQTQSGAESISAAMKSVENSLGMIATAFEKQLDNLYKDRTLDIQTDIDVLETMMASDGLTGKDSIQQTAQAGTEM